MIFWERRDFGRALIKIGLVCKVRDNLVLEVVDLMYRLEDVEYEVAKPENGWILK